MMADAFKRGRLETAIWAAKVLLLCVGTVSTVVFFKAAIIPYLLNLCLSIVPHIRTSFKNCCSLSPLYIYIILNFIILTIAASSAFQRQNHNHKHHLSSSSVASGDTTKNNAKATDRIDPSHDFIYSPDNNTDNKYNSSQSQMLSAQPPQQQDRLFQSHPEDDATFLFSSSSLDNHPYTLNNEMISWHDIHTVQEGVVPNTILRTSTTTLEYDDHQRSGPSPEKCCGDSMPTEEEEVEADDDTKTLDTTWKAIMDGQGKASGKHLKKSDTWDTPPRLTGRQLAITNTKFKVPQRQLNQCNLDDDHDDEDDAVTWARRELKKSDTFSDRVSLRRQKSMSQEELNQRAEAFIKKINNDIRLERLESDQRRFREIASTAI
ncbi:hypothetical protein C1H46_039914 [Malus baccata]|uniref:DUF4408 domain-containing protein n=1 Tax=Malus baccata TaxID=106549 RepID=A0A540KK09_MALBA|nr:hypothetical protein C1H46_039914 [Malus baccata]